MCPWSSRASQWDLDPKMFSSTHRGSHSLNGRSLLWLYMDISTCLLFIAHAPQFAREREVSEAVLTCLGPLWRKDHWRLLAFCSTLFYLKVDKSVVKWRQRDNLKQRRWKGNVHRCIIGIFGLMQHSQSKKKVIHCVSAFLKKKVDWLLCKWKEAKWHYTGEKLSCH